VDEAALADTERAEEAARAHAAAAEHTKMRSAGGTATMAGPHAQRIQSAGGTGGAGAQRDQRERDGTESPE
jgi:hypothetical protein